MEIIRKCGLRGQVNGMPVPGRHSDKLEDRCIEALGGDLRLALAANRSLGSALRLARWLFFLAMLANGAGWILALWLCPGGSP